jgi:parvulin-like peptidyl-prolyl isomerase
MLSSGCSSLTSPPEREVDPEIAPAPTASVPRPAATVIPVQAPPPKEEERAQASHILVAYKGARNAPPTVTRTKEQAMKRAENVLRKAKKGGDFPALATQYSDDPGSGPRGGDLGSFTRTTMVKPFSDAAFALRPGELSAVVETDFGFHVIRRTQ